MSTLLDPSLGINYDQDQMERMVLASTLCIRRAPRARPQMSLVSHLSAISSHKSLVVHASLSSFNEPSLDMYLNFKVKQEMILKEYMY